ncbi:MAG: hypothetical protein EOO05_06070 [Chitinophagaceae bacterium]|nr:MAG: hypothetical protein EOO05_06070 [Chitinophagaceae bacterium]
MKLQLPIPRPGTDEERLGKIRFMVLNFRKRSLTIADHVLISAWLEESEANQRLFEKWILEPKPAGPSGRLAGSGQEQLTGAIRKNRMIALVIVFVCALLLFLIMR